MNRIITLVHPVLNWFAKKILKRDISINTARQFTKHYFVGFAGSLFNYTMFNILKYSGLPTKTANIITGVILIVTIFIVQKYFTYKPDHYSFWQPLLFITNSVIYLLLDTSILVLLIDKWLIDPKIAKLISMMVLSPMSFLFQKFIVFKNKGELHD